MDLNRAGREYYVLELEVTDVAGGPVTDPGDFEASFDGGTTWVTGQQMSGTGWWQWLVQGPLFDAVADPLTGGATLAATISAPVQPWVRLVDNPESLVFDDIPSINLTPR